MTLKPLYKYENKVLVGLAKDFQEVCVLDGLVVEIDLDARKPIAPPQGGLSILRKGLYTPIRQKEKTEYSRLIEKKLKRKQLRKIEEDLESPSDDSIESLSWIPDRLDNSNGDIAQS